MALTRKAIFVVGAKRTPFCKYGGYLRELPASQVFAAAAKDALNSANLDPTSVDCTIIGNVNFLSQCDGGKTPRYCGLYSGVPIEKPALGVNKACGSGLQAIITGAMEISVGSAKACLTGGTEIMSSLPYLVRNKRFGSTLGKPYSFEDYIKNQVLDSYTGLTLQKMAEIVATKYKISRQMADDFSYNSHLKFKAASSKILQLELASLTVQFKKEEIIVDNDELDFNSDFNNFISSPTTISDGTVVTSLNSSAPADGAAALVLADEESTHSNNLTPLARVVAYACVGDDPHTALGTVAAVKRLLHVTGTTVDDVDMFEINETFAAEVLATIKELKLEQQKVNISGGALALGHPVAATGARMAVHLVHQLRNRNAKRAIAVSSCGGGQGLAVMFESL